MLHIPTGPRPGATVEEVKAWIKSIDTNKDGIISKKELETALRGLELWFAGWRATWAVKKNDLNCNGFIDTPEEFEELQKFVQSGKRQKCSMPIHPPIDHASPPDPTIKEIRAWIKSIDTNRDGIITKEELATALRRLQVWFANLWASSAIRNADLNNNGCIDTPAEFKKFESYVKNRWGHIIASNSGNPSN